MQQHPSSEINANQQIARISMENSATVNRLNCRAKGGTAGYKVAILGATSVISQPFAMLMKMNPLVSVLHLYDVVNTPNVTSYISQMDTVLIGMKLVIIPADVPRKPRMTRDDLFNINAGIVQTISEAIARCYSNAIVNVITGTFDPKKPLGVTMLDVVRANTFVAEVLGLDPKDVCIPVVRGHAGVTILPLLSQVKPPCSFTPKEVDNLTYRIQNGETEVVEHIEKSTWESKSKAGKQKQSKKAKLYLPSFSAGYANTASEQPPLRPIHGFNWKEQRHQLSNRLAASIIPNPSLMY
ncbi:unnamed protein product [Malus baccata var. baccata]